jgi:hypothetical protein
MLGCWMELLEHQYSHIDISGYSMGVLDVCMSKRLSGGESCTRV